MTESDSIDTSSRLQKVLIVEDNKQTRELMRKFFDKACNRGDLKCMIIEASNGESAIKMLESEEPDLILCDIGLPDIDGFGVLKYYKEDYKLRHPFCFFTFLTASASERKKAFEESALSFLAKTEINYYTLTLQVKTWLRLSFLERSLEIQQANEDLDL